MRLNYTRLEIFSPKDTDYETAYHIGEKAFEKSYIYVQPKDISYIRECMFFNKKACEIGVNGEMFVVNMDLFKLLNELDASLFYNGVLHRVNPN